MVISGLSMRDDHDRNRGALAFGDAVQAAVKSPRETHVLALSEVECTFGERGRQSENNMPGELNSLINNHDQFNQTAAWKFGGTCMQVCKRIYSVSAPIGVVVRSAG